MTKTATPTPSPAPPLFGMLPMPQQLDELPPPDNGPYYVIGPDKIYIYKWVHQGRVLIPVNKIEHLPNPLGTHGGWIWMTADRIKLPGEFVGRVWSFFRSVYNRRHSEAMVYITWHREHGHRIFVPPQRASGGGVHAKFNPEHLQPGWRLIGTIHSHCDFGAFHSGTDTHDADGHDGIHMTIGKVKSNPPDIAVMISVNGVRWDLKPDSVIDGDLVFTKHPAWWERYIDDPLPTNVGKHVSSWQKPPGSESLIQRMNRGPVTRPVQGTLPFPPAPKVVSGQRSPSVLYTTTDDLFDLADQMIRAGAAPDWVNPQDFEELTYIIASQIEDIQEDLQGMGIRFQPRFDLHPDPKPSTTVDTVSTRSRIHEQGSIDELRELTDDEELIRRYQRLIAGEGD